MDTSCTGNLKLQLESVFNMVRYSTPVTSGAFLLVSLLRYGFLADTSVIGLS